MRPDHTRTRFPKGRSNSVQGLAAIVYGLEHRLSTDLCSAAAASAPGATPEHVTSWDERENALSEAHAFQAS